MYSVLRKLLFPSLSDLLFGVFLTLTGLELLVSPSYLVPVVILNFSVTDKLSYLKVHCAGVGSNQGALA